MQRATDAMMKGFVLGALTARRRFCNIRQTRHQHIAIHLSRSTVNQPLAFTAKHIQLN
jgi:hypothetical protein